MQQVVSLHNITVDHNPTTDLLVGTDGSTTKMQKVLTTDVHSEALALAKTFTHYKVEQKISSNPDQFIFKIVL